MTKSKFIRIMRQAIRKTKEGELGGGFTCNILRLLNPPIMWDYKKVFSEAPGESYIPTCFQSETQTVDYTHEEVLEIRLNALTMYMVQALEFETYKDL